MRVVLVEDDPDQITRISGALQKAVAGANVEAIRTELEFQERLPSILADPPALVVIDVMVERSSLANDEVEFPFDDTVFHDAGFRCEKLLRDHGSSAPVIIYSVLDRSDIDAELQKLSSKLTTYVRKEFELESLISHVRAITRRTQR